MTDQVTDRARLVLEAAWRPDGGYSSPNLATYPWMWLWDSCFHAIIWAVLEDPRALKELDSVFHWQTDAGFVPHMGYQLDPPAARQIWRQDGASTITQPPMYGHAARLLVEAGVDVPDALFDRMWAGLDWLWEHRLRDGVVVLCHPWESGCDDSPRWHPEPADSWDRPGWGLEKLRLVSSLAVEGRAAEANPVWEVGSAGFNALVAFNVAELSAVAPRAGWAGRLELLRDALELRWSDATGLWIDEPAGAGSAVPVLDALLPLLVVDRPDWPTLLAPFQASFGPRYLPAGHPSYDPHTYWRGPAWPQLTYLLWVAATRSGHTELAGGLAQSLVAGAEASDWSEYWNPETGQGHGARPQSWTGLAAVVAAGLRN